MFDPVSALIGGGAMLLGGLLGGGSEPNVNTNIIPKPPEYTDFVKLFLGDWEVIEDPETGEKKKVFRGSPYIEALRAYQNFFRSPPYVSLGGLRLPAFGLLNAYRRAIEGGLSLGREAWYPLNVETIASPSVGQMLGGGMMGIGGALLGSGLGLFK